MTPSDVVSLTYTLSEAGNVLIPSVASGSVVRPGDLITFSTPISGGLIYLTTDGSEPVPGQSPQSSSVTVSGSYGQTFTVRGAVSVSGGAAATSHVFTYTIADATAQPSATPAAGVVVEGTEVKLTTGAQGATIYYEIAYGSSYPDDPDASRSQTFSENTPIVIDRTTTIRAIASRDQVDSNVVEFRYTVADKVADPVPSIPGGTVVARGTKVTLSTSNGASIIYTKDGSEPTVEGNKNRMFGSDIVLDATEGQSVNISAYATKSGMTPSNVISLSYTVSKEEDVLHPSLEPGSTVKPGDQITLSTSLTDATVYFTTDGTDPVTTGSSATTKGNTVTVDGDYGATFTIRAVVQTGNNLAVTTPYLFSYNILARTSPPSSSIPSGYLILPGAPVELTATGEETQIFYTLDGSDPTTASLLYKESFKLSNSVVLTAIAQEKDTAPSEISQYVYTLADQVEAPVASRPSGALEVGDKISMTCGTEGATIYYSTNGVDPTTENLKDMGIFDAELVISRPVTIKMFAVKSGMRASAVNTVTYTVVEPPPPEEEEEEADPTLLQAEGDRLFRFDQFVGEGEGPRFSDLQITDPQSLVMLSALADALPDGVTMVVEQERNPTPEDKEAVKRTIDLQMESLYYVTLLQDGVPVQPTLENSVEIGLPIPSGYRDTVTLICHIDDNGVVEALPTRRSGDTAYAVVSHFSKFALAVPEPWYRQPQNRWLTILGAIASCTVLPVTGMAVYTLRGKKRKKAD